MPGPCNSRKKKKNQLKKQEKTLKTRSARESLEAQPVPKSPSVHSRESPFSPTFDEGLGLRFDPAPPLSTSTSKSTSASYSPDTFTPLDALPTPETGVYIHEPEPSDHDHLQPKVIHQMQYESDGLPLPKIPFIQDPGNGPRVRDTRTFLSSSFAAPPSLEDPLCAEFAQEELLQMLCSVLPEETAMILWYNKSRLKARICPACQRLYRLGDVLRDHHDNFTFKLDDHEENGEPRRDEKASEMRFREQQISGLCSPVCFILASYNYPLAIRSTWGRMAEDLTDETWELLSASTTRTNDMGLGLLLKMTRCHDLGLGQLVFPDLDLDEEDSESGGDVREERYEFSDSDYSSEEECAEDRVVRVDITQNVPMVEKPTSDLTQSSSVVVA